MDGKFKIFITGTGELTESLKKEAANDSKITFTGRIEDEDLKAYILACDIFCFPSITKNEAFGVALAEAMYYGKPAVTFNIPGSGVNYVCLDRENGIEVANRQSDLYSKALRKLAHSPELRSKYGELSKQRVMDKFLYSSYINNIGRLINEM